MEDIIVDEPAPTSIRSRKQKKFRRIRPGRDLTVYLFDWLVKGLMIALLLGINFLLFASAGNFSVSPLCRRRAGERRGKADRPRRRACGRARTFS